MFLNTNTIQHCLSWAEGWSFLNYKALSVEKKIWGYYIKSSERLEYFFRSGC